MNDTRIEGTAMLHCCCGNSEEIALDCALANIREEIEIGAEQAGWSLGVEAFCPYCHRENDRWKHETDSLF